MGYNWWEHGIYTPLLEREKEISYLLTLVDLLVRGCLHVSESPYELPYDSVHNFYANRIGIQLFVCRPLQWFVFTF
jgi:hypothetical protein